MLRWIGSVVGGALTGLLKFALAIVIVFVVIALIGALTRETVPGTTVLTVDLRGEFPDKPAVGTFGPADRTTSLVGLIETLAAAENDDRVKGVYMRAGVGGFPVSAAEEIHDAIKRLRDKGKFVVVHAQAFYSAGLADYFAVASADEIWLQPGSTFEPAGVGGAALFAKGLLAKLDVNEHISKRFEYKNAANTFQEDDFTDAHREATLGYMQSIYDTATAGIAAARGIDRQTLIGLLDTAPHSSSAALDAKLVDRLGYDHDAADAAKERAGEGAELLSIAEYVGRAGPLFMAGPAIAVVHASGSIFDGESQPDPFSGGSEGIGGDTFARAIRAAADDETVKAIVFRVDSGGGSAIASDQILQAVKYAQEEKQKPVIVSMGSAAASGGYWVSMSADTIYAAASTITGSIGVFGGKIQIDGAYALLGINFRPIGVGRNALSQSAFTGYTPEQQAKVDEFIDGIYTDFTSKVAEHRELELTDVLEVAKGRVWTGADAKARGLVDEIGGYRAALEAAREAGGIDPDDLIQIKRFPGDPDPFEALMQAFGASAETAARLAQLARALEVSGIADALSTLAAAERQNGLQMHEPAQPPR